MSEFRKTLAEAINAHSRENGSDTPDFLLAEYLNDCLAAFDRAVKAREKWYGREPKTAMVHEGPAAAVPGRRLDGPPGPRRPPGHWPVG